jgi:hypothetical protein
MKMINGRKGFTLSGIMEAILVIVAFIFITNLAIGGFNISYGQNLSLPTGLAAETQIINQTLSNQAGSSANQTLGGEVQQNSFGFGIIQAGSLFLAFLSTAWYVVTGGWIPAILTMATNSWSGAILIGNLLRIFLVIGLVFALIRVVQRIRP